MRDNGQLGCLQHREYCFSYATQAGGQVTYIVHQSDFPPHYVGFIVVNSVDALTSNGTSKLQVYTMSCLNPIDFLICWMTHLIDGLQVDILW